MCLSYHKHVIGETEGMDAWTYEFSNFKATVSAVTEKHSSLFRNQYAISRECNILWCLHALTAGRKNPSVLQK